MNRRICAIASLLDFWRFESGAQRFLFWRVQMFSAREVAQTFRRRGLRILLDFHIGPYCV